MKTLLNGIAYSFVDISFSIGNLKKAPLVGFNGLPIKSLSYNATQQKTMNYANSKYAIDVSLGKMQYSGNVGLTADAAEQLRDSIFALGVPERSICACPAVDIQITFSNKGKVQTTILENVMFTTENLTGSEGNDTIAVSCDFICSYIEFGAAINPIASAQLVFDYIGQDNQAGSF